MRRFALLVLFAPCAFAQFPISIGVKGGVPLTDFFTLRPGQFPFQSDTKRYTIGPMFELNLPFRTSIEFDVLYKRFNYTASYIDPVAGQATIDAAGNSFEFPLLLKHRFSEGIVRPYLAAGLAFNRITGLKRVTQFFSLSGGPGGSSTDEDPEELRNRSSTGVVVGGGLEVRALILKISPEVRYTRWGVANIRDVGGLINSNKNQAEFLVGISF